MFDIVDVLEKMETACPVKCTCSISSIGDHIHFRWDYTIGRVPYGYERRVSKVEYKLANIDLIEQIVCIAKDYIKQYIEANADV